MKKVKASPGAKRLIESLRNMGYDCNSAIADLVDNSITAQASRVDIEIAAQHGARPAAVVIADNGRGMDREQLIEAMRFGAFQEYSPEDLGKYGLGLKTASLSQCSTLTVSSRARAANGQRPRRVSARWDITHVNQRDDWELLLPSSGDLNAWEAEAIASEVAEEHGTVVVWSDLEEALPMLSAHDVQLRDRHLAKLIDDVGNHLRMVFHRFMQGIVPGRRRLHIYLNGVELKPWDPFCRDESTQELEILSLPIQAINGSKITIQPFVLPREDEFSDVKAWREAAGPRSWNQQQGFYFYRNHRLLQAGGWSWLRAVDEHVKLLRVAVDFPGELDRAFSVNVTKMRARIPAEIREPVGSAVGKWVKIARDRYDRRPSGYNKGAKGRVYHTGGGTKKPDAPPTINVGPISFSLSNAPSHSLTVSPGKSLGQLRVIVPHGHEFAGIFTPSRTERDELRKLCLAMLSLLEAVYEGRMEPSSIPIQALKRAFSKNK